MVEVRPSPRHGRGVFATRHIAGGEQVLACPALLLHPDDRAAVEGTPVAHVLVEWDDDGVGAIPLGSVALLNHASDPNCELVTAETETGPTIEVWTQVPVRADEELTIDYVAGCPRDLWFDPA